MRIWNDLTTLGKHGLNAITLRHRAITTGEHLLDMLQRLRVETKFAVKRVCDGLPGQVI